MFGFGSSIDRLHNEAGASSSLHVWVLLSLQHLATASPPWSATLSFATARAAAVLPAAASTAARLTRHISPAAAARSPPSRRHRWITLSLTFWRYDTAIAATTFAISGAFIGVELYGPFAQIR